MAGASPKAAFLVREGSRFSYSSYYFFQTVQPATRSTPNLPIDHEVDPLAHGKVADAHEVTADTNIAAMITTNYPTLITNQPLLLPIQ
ncbi:hypothetical protein [Ammoniphilus sp. YIM 78166]|uniref:hypothetical protein n=1 Tax=Ammoniphilus sp. YIM 78166 TaxID=1644106 RepID=UPI00107048EA|nr:hypothetical protein [Ammoniphilus sp. YIM 78166]